MTERDTLVLNIEGNASAELKRIQNAVDATIDTWGDHVDALKSTKEATDRVLDGLKALGRRGNEAAAAIEQISDPTQRLIEAQKALNREMGQVGSTASKLEGKFDALKGRIAAIPAPYKAVAAGTAAVGAAMVALATKGIEVAISGWKEFALTNERAAKSMEMWEQSTSKALKTIGRSLEEHGNVSEKVAGSATLLERETERFVGEAEALGGMVLPALIFQFKTMGELIPVIGEVTGGLTDRLGQLSEEAERLGKTALDNAEKLDQFHAQMLRESHFISEDTRKLLENRNALVEWRMEKERAKNALFTEDISDQEMLAALGMGASTPTSAPKGGGGGGARGPIADVQQVAQAGSAFAGFAAGQDVNVGILGGITTAIAVAGRAIRKEQATLVAVNKTLVDDLMKPYEAIAEGLELGEERINATIATMKADAELVKVNDKLWASFSDTLTGMVQPAILGVTQNLAGMFTMMARGQMNMADFGNGLTTMIGQLVGQIAPAFMTLGAGMIATGTGNPVGMISAGIALAAIAGTLAAFGGSESGGGAASAGGGASELRSIAREFKAQDERGKEERTIIVQIGTREISRELSDQRRRGFF